MIEYKQSAWKPQFLFWNDMAVWNMALREARFKIGTSFRKLQY